MFRMTPQKGSGIILNYLSGVRNAKRKTRKLRLNREGYKTLRKFEKKRKENLTTEEKNLLDSLLKKASINIKDKNYKQLLDKRYNLTKRFNSFGSPTNEKNLSVSEILNKDLPTSKRISQKYKNFIRGLTDKPYKKVIIKTRKTNKNKNIEQIPVREKDSLRNIITLLKTNRVFKKEYANLTFCGNSCFIDSTVQLFYRIPSFRQAILNVDLTNPAIQNYFYKGIADNTLPLNAMFKDFYEKPHQYKGEPLVALQSIFKKMAAAEQRSIGKIDVRNFYNDHFECIDTAYTPRLNPLTGTRAQQDISSFIQGCIIQKLLTPPTSHLVKNFYFYMTTQVQGRYDTTNPLLQRDIRGKITHYNYKNDLTKDSTYILNDLEPLSQLPILKGPELNKELNSILNLSLQPYTNADTVELQHLINVMIQVVESIDDASIPKVLQIPASLPQDATTPLISPIPGTAQRIYTYVIPDTLQYLLINLARVNYQGEKVEAQVKLNTYIDISGVYFELDAICNHLGSVAGSGHFTYYGKELNGKGWLEMDDTEPFSYALTPTGQQEPFIDFKEKQDPYDQVSITANVLLYKRSRITQDQYNTYLAEVQQFIQQKQIQFVVT